jgi:hypothetical protein
MTTTLREMLARQANEAGPPSLDIDKLVGRGETRLRRRRIAAAAGSAAVAAVVVVTLVLGAALHGTVKRGEAPVNRPSPSPTETPAPPVRKLLYSDVPMTHAASWPSPRKGTIHFGDRAIETGDAFVHLDVTDDGFVYTDVAGVQFNDGGRTEQIGSRLCVLGNGVGLHAASGAVMTGAAGSLVAWFECANPKSPALVVYDTGSGREVSREPMPFCATVFGCHLYAVIGEHIYFTWTRDDRASSERQFSYDVTTGRRSPVTSRSFADDTRSHPRRLLVGKAWETATPAGSGGAVASLVFRAVGTRLVAYAGEANGESPTTAFDTATHQAVRLGLPPGYHPSTGSYRVFEWLDDDTVALTQDHNLQSTDIITCRLSEGRCQLAVKAGPDQVVRIIPSTALPG